MNFIKNNKLNVHQEMVTHSIPTFYHNDGKSTSQIDYIFSNNDIIGTTIVMEHDPINSSSHLPVIANLTKTLQATAKKGKKSHSTYKLLWEEVDKKEYQNVFNQLLTTCNWNNYDVNGKINQLTYLLHKTTDKVVPKKLIKLNGFKYKASPKVRQLIQTSKQKHREWDNAGRPRNDHKLFLEKKAAKRALRRQQRKERAIEREQFLQRLEKDPNDKAFFQMIKRNQSNETNNTPEILVDGIKTAKTPSSQRETFAEYFNNLATPQDNQNFKDELLSNSTKRCKLIKDVSKNMTKKKILVNQQEIINAIQKLKNGKSSDEYGITAEHIKYAGKETIHIYQSIFNQIFDEGKVATTFKTGVITPVPKKGKDLTQTTNYRGITVTSAHGKVFEYVLVEKAKLNSIKQSNLQFGFSEGLSPNMAALILSEVCSELKGKEMIFITTLDSQKAFDVVSHQILLNKLLSGTRY